MQVGAAVLLAVRVVPRMRGVRGVGKRRWLGGARSLAHAPPHPVARHLLHLLEAVGGRLQCAQQLLRPQGTRLVRALGIRVRSRVRFKGWGPNLTRNP